jgi:glycosyltransferase involved in cell wall biosynthesis
VTTVAFDVRANHDTGVSRYGLSLLAAAAPHAIGAGWRLIAVARPQQEARAREAVAHLGVRVLSCPDDEGFVRRSSWLRSQLRALRADLLYTSHYLVDRECPIPFVHTIHDLTRLRYPGLSYTDASFAARFGLPELHLARQELAALAPAASPSEPVFASYFRALNEKLAGRAQRIVTVSRSTADDIKHVLGVSEDRLDLVPCAVDATVFFPRTDEQARGAMATYGLADSYVIYAGLAHPSKRFDWLLQALTEARAAFPQGTKLVVTGGHAERNARVREILSRSGAQNFVVFTGRVEDAVLAALYTGAAAYVTAAISEGYGLPMAEALACGTRVVATDIPVLRETLGTAALFYPADDSAQFAGLVHDALVGNLPRQAAVAGHDWDVSGALLVKSLGRALDDLDRDAGQAARDDHERPADQTLRMRA